MVISETNNSSVSVAGQDYLSTLKKNVDDAQEILKSINREEQPKEWAEIQITLGDSLYLLGEAEQGETQYFELAVQAYNDALEVFTQNETRMVWADIQTKIGDTMRILFNITGGNVKFLEKGVESYKNALEVIKNEKKRATITRYLEELQVS